MFHSTIDIASATDLGGLAAGEADCPIRKELALLAAGLDTRFLRVGTTLAGAIGMIDRMIGGLDGIASALDANVAGAAVADLHAVARDLSTLPAAQAARGAHMAAVADIAKALRDHVMEMHQTLRILNIYGINIKIAASGEPQFVGFVDGMTRRLGTGEELLLGFMARIKDVTAGVEGVQQAGRLLVAECSRVIPAAPEKLVADAIALEAYLGETASLARTVAAIARRIHAKVAVVLGALQVGDSTRQRLEHVVSSLQLLDATAVEGNIDPAVAAHVEALLAAQVEATMQDFARETSALISSLAELHPDTKKLATLIVDQGDGKDRAFLAELDQGISDVEHVTSQLRKAAIRSRDMAGVIADTVADLTTRLDSVQRIALDVQDIATNTRLLCRRHGTTGRAVAVIAIEVDAYALTLGAATAAVAHATGLLGSVDTAPQAADHDADGRDMGDTLASALTVIRHACERTKQVAVQGADDADQLVALVAATSGDLRQELAVTDVMAAAMDSLSQRTPATALTDAAEATLHVLLPAIGRFYTMAQERAVHARFLLPGMETVASAAAVADDDDDDDGLF